MRNTLQQISSLPSLREAWNFEKRRLRRSSYGVDRVSGKQFEADQNFQFYRLSQGLRGQFEPQGLLAVAKPKLTGGFRIICVPTIGDRVIQFSLLAKIRDSLTQRGLLNNVSFGLVANAGRTVQDARIKALGMMGTGKWTYKADIEKFFDNIPRPAVKDAIRRIVPHRSLHKVLDAFVDTEIEDGFDVDWQRIVADAGIVEGKGVRQGMPLSPYFAGILLRDLDRVLEKGGLPIIRYVDDIIGFFDTKEQCEQFDNFLRSQLSKLALSLGALGGDNSKTKIFTPHQSPDFLGMELGRDPQGKAFLSIATQTIQKIGSKFAALSNVDALLQKGVTLPTLGSRLDAMERGYIAAYQGAKNLGDLKVELTTLKQICLTNVMEDMFGEQALNLSKKKRRFLGID